MHRLTSLAVALVAASAGAVLCTSNPASRSAAAQAPAPIAQPEESAPTRRLPSFDFGTIRDLAPREHAFRVENDTRETWRVTHTWTQCGCITPVACTPSIAPGESLELTVHFDPSAQAEGAWGREVYALIEPGPWRLVVPSRAFLLKPPHLDPEVVAVALAGGESDFSARFRVRVPYLAGPNALEALDAPADVVLSTESVEPTPFGSVLTCLVRGTLTNEHVRRDLALDLRVRERPEDPCQLLRLGVHVRRARGLDVSPRALVLDACRGGAAAAVWVKTPDGASARELEWTIDPPSGLDCSYSPETGRLSVRLMPGHDVTRRDYSVHLTSAGAVRCELPVRVLDTEEAARAR